MIALIDPKTLAHKKILCVFQPMQISPRWETWIAGAPFRQLDFSVLPALKKALLWKSKATYSRANPRNFAYMLEALREVVSQSGQKPELHLLAPVSEDASAVRELFQARWDFSALERLRAEAYDAVVFLYPDAIGFGWNRVERAVARLHIPRRYVLNGRRRFFPLDSVARRRLLGRRFLERTWLVEFALALFFALLSLPLALYDFLKKGSR